MLNFLEPLELFNFFPKIHPEMSNLEIIYVEDERVGDRHWGRFHYFRVHVGNYRPGRHGVGSAEFFDFSWTCPYSPRIHHPFLGQISGHQIRFSPQFDLHCWPQSGLYDLHFRGCCCCWADDAHCHCSGERLNSFCVQGSAFSSRKRNKLLFFFKSKIDCREATDFMWSWLFFRLEFISEFLKKLEAV